MPHRNMLLPALAVFCLAVSASALADPSVEGELSTQSGESSQEGRFLRLTRDDDGAPIALEAAIVRFAPADPGRTVPTVDLISAVHVAEESFYDELNRLFAEYDVVLYELVAPEGTQIPKGGAPPSRHPVSMLQRGMTDMLELEFQLEGVDYTRGNLVHADMSPEQFAESMRNRGESMFQVFFRMLGYAMARQAEDPAGTSDFRMLMAFFDKDRTLALKRVMAEQFEDLEGSLSAINGPEGSTLIGERNKVALGVLRKQIEAGKQKLAIFYGAGHMSHFEERLRKDFGLAPVSTRWLTAWNLTGKAEARESVPENPTEKVGAPE